MKTSQRGLNDLVASEGIRTNAYKDSKGVWTIGVGHTSMAGPPAVHPGLTLTRSEVFALLAKDIAKFEKRVDAALGTVPQNVFDGAVSFDFNTGSIDTASWPKLYKAGKLAEAHISFMRWNKPPEIIGRRKREAALIFEGKYSTGAVSAGVPNAPTPSDPPAGEVAANPPASGTTPDAAVNNTLKPTASGSKSKAGPIATMATGAATFAGGAAAAQGLSWGWIAIVVVAVLVVGAVVFVARKG